MALYVRERSFLFGCQGRTDTNSTIFGALHTLPKPVSHKSHVSLPVIISGHGFCGYAWHSRSEGGPFSLAARQELTLVLEFWELYILHPSQ